ncbi:MAG: M48 family metalloprotease [Pseudomonadota bacterium]
MAKTGFDADAAVAEFVARHVAECQALGCVSPDESLSVAINLIIFPLAILLAAILLFRLGIFRALYAGCLKTPRRPWLARAGFGALIAFMFVVGSLPFALLELFDLLSPIETPRMVHNCVGDFCPPAPSVAERLLPFFREQIWRAFGLAVPFAALAPIAFYLWDHRPKAFLAVVVIVYLGCWVAQSESHWADSYAVPEGALRDDVEEIARRADIDMKRVLIGVPDKLGAGLYDARAGWHKGSTKAVMSERMLNIHWAHPRVYKLPLIPITAAEFRAVTAHELAHLKHRHSEAQIALVAVFVTMFVGLTWRSSRHLSSRFDALNAASPSTAQSLVLFFAFGFALHFVHLPIHRNLVRIMEHQADAMGLELARDPDGAASFHAKAARGGALVQDRWYHLLYRTHPDDLSRIRRAMEWKAVNQPGNWTATGLAGELRQRSADWLEPITDWPELGEAAR